MKESLLLKNRNFIYPYKRWPADQDFLTTRKSIGVTVKVNRAELRISDVNNHHSFLYFFNLELKGFVLDTTSF